MSPRPDILPSLGMLGMDVSPTLLSMGYHHVFGLFKQAFRLKIHFHKMPKIVIHHFQLSLCFSLVFLFDIFFKFPCFDCRIAAGFRFCLWYLDPSISTALPWSWFWSKFPLHCHGAWIMYLIFFPSLFFFPIMLLDLCFWFRCGLLRCWAATVLELNHCCFSPFIFIDVSFLQYR